MPLKIMLKPGEKIILNGAVITNGDRKTEFVVNNDVTLMREKDVMTAEQANSPSKRLYFTIQCMYMRGSLDTSKEYHHLFHTYLSDWLNACPSTIAICMDIGESVLSEDFWQAMKACKKLMEHEEKVMSNV
jgi:flagellar protein FlbT